MSINEILSKLVNAKELDLEGEDGQIYLSRVFTHDDFEQAKKIYRDTANTDDMEMYLAQAQSFKQLFEQIQ